MTTVITSAKNPRIKELLKLGKRNHRDETRRTVVEGGREISLALQAGLVPTQVFRCTSLLDDTSRLVADRCSDLAGAGQTALLDVSTEVFARIAYRGTTGGLIAVVGVGSRSLEDLPAASASLVLVVDGAEKPGNLGALLRTADAAGVDLVVVSGNGTDIDNPNVIRASLGAIFTVPVVQTEASDAISWLREGRHRIVAASPDAIELYTDSDLTGKVAIVVGSEAYGISELWRKECDLHVRIPMAGRVDSLNLSASTAILLFEAVRQRSTVAQH